MPGGWRRPFGSSIASNSTPIGAPAGESSASTSRSANWESGYTPPSRWNTVPTAEGCGRGAPGSAGAALPAGRTHCSWKPSMISRSSLRAAAGTLAAPHVALATSTKTRHSAGVMARCMCASSSGRPV